MEVEQKKREQAAIRSMESAGVVSVPLLIGISPHHQDQEGSKPGPA